MPRSSDDARQLELAAAFTDLGPAWGRWVTVCTPADSVSYIRLRLLRVLEQQGESTMTQLADFLNLTQRRITDLTLALTRDGYVDRRPNPQDGRSSIISLTDDGRAHLAQTWSEFQTDVAAAFGDLPVKQQHELLAITPVLTAALRKRIAEKQAE
ncbi:hypothetical protein GCM10027568_30150 [Humibacter soli]